MSEEKTLPQLLEELEQARTNLITANEEEMKARATADEIIHKAVNRTVDARNVYNGLSVRIDVAMRKLKETAPEETAWAGGTTL